MIIRPIYNQTRGKWFKSVLRNVDGYLVASWTANLASVVATFPGEDREADVQRTLADLKRSYPYDTFIAEEYTVETIYTKRGSL